MSLYTIRKTCAIYQVVCGCVVVFSSIYRKRCEDWKAENEPSPIENTQQ